MWWSWARGFAQQQGLGQVYSAGRMGGWLVLDEWPLSKIEEFLDDIEDRCSHCDRPEDEHANGQCLFTSATSYAPVKRLMKETKERLDEVLAFTVEIRDSVEGIGQELQYCFEQRIEEAFNEREEEHAKTVA
jgi:superfamily II DNA/RNA helicase